MKTLCWIVLLACGAAFPWSAWCRDIFVNNVIGDDRSAGRTPDVLQTRGPVHTIAKALRLAESGDRVVLANTGEPYRESLALEGVRMSGVADDRFTLVGNGAILEGARATSPDAWEFVSGVVFRFRPSRLGYQQLFLHGLPAIRRPINAPDGALPDLEPLEWCLYAGFIYFAVEPGRVPENYEPSVAELPTGVLLNQVRNVLIENLIVEGFQLDGINAHDGAIGVEMRGVTLRGNGRSGARVAGSSRVVLRKCLLGDNGAAQLLVNGYSQADAIECELLPNTAPAFIERSGVLRIDGRRAEASAAAPSR
jgi:hypothetical protein